MRAVSGVEAKGILISSVDNVTVHMSTDYSTSSYRFPDSTIVRPVAENDTEYFIASFDIGTTSSSYRPKAIYMVVATEDDTEVAVFHKDSYGYESPQIFIIHKHEVFTKDAYREGSSHYAADYTGSRVLANKPVKVYSGHGAVSFYATVSSVC